MFANPCGSKNWLHHSFSEKWFPSTDKKKQCDMPIESIIVVGILWNSVRAYKTAS